MELVKTVAVLSVAFAASSVFALPKGFQANPTGATTKSIQVEGVKHIGVTLENEGEHKGKASIFVSDTEAVSGTPEKGIANNKPVSFAKIDATANKYFVKTFAHGILGKDKNGVTVANLYRMNGAWHLIPKMPDHSHLGRLSYSKVGNMDVYFGDWSAVPSGAAVGTKGTNYTAFYSGTGRTHQSADYGYCHLYGQRYQPIPRAKFYRLERYADSRL